MTTCLVRAAKKAALWIVLTDEVESSLRTPHPFNNSRVMMRSPNTSVVLNVLKAARCMQWRKWTCATRLRATFPNTIFAIKHVCLRPGSNAQFHGCRCCSRCSLLSVGSADCHGLAYRHVCG